MDLGIAVAICSALISMVSIGVATYVNLRVKPLDEGVKEILKEVRSTKESLHQLELKLAENYVTYEVLPEKILTELHKHGLVVISKPK
jgi:hypothetical protein